MHYYNYAKKLKNSHSSSGLIPVSAKCSLGLAVVSALSATPLYAQNDTGFLEEVVVTAQRREERSLDVPISITSIGTESLGKGDVQQLSDIMKLTPGLRFDNQGSLSQPTIRGVGTAVAVSGGGSNVGIYTDGFYSPNPFFADSDFLRPESVQVLKGPQGTLFGRNSTGGAILVTTPEPSSEFSGEIEGSYGSFATSRVQAYLTGGPSDALAFDLAVQARKSDGYLDNYLLDQNFSLQKANDDAGGYDRKSLRIGALWHATDSTSVLLRYSQSDIDDGTSVTANSYEENGQQFAAAAAFGIPLATESDAVSLDFQPQFIAKSDVYQLTVKTELPFASLTSYTQYRSERTDNLMDFDFSPIPIFHYRFDVDEEIFTQEFLLTSSGDKIDWTAGLFYFQDESTYKNNQASFGGAPFFRNGGSSTLTTSVAAFVDVTFELSDNLFLTAGLRAGYDEITDAYLTLGVDALGNLIQADVDDVDDTSATPRLVLRYTPTDNSSVFLSYTQGYKAGVLNVGGDSLAGVEVDPEKIQAYELGYKFQNGQLTFDASTFYYDYQDLQVATFDGPTSIIENAANSTVYGLDLQLRYAFNEQFNVLVGGTYINAEYENFDRSQSWAQCLDFVACGAGFGLFIPEYVSADGNEMLRSPEFTANLGLFYTIDIGGGAIDLSSTIYYTSDFYFDSSEAYQQEGYELVSLRAEWTDASDSISVALFADNVTDSEYRTQVLPQQLGALSMWGAPATIGASVNYRF